jgi:hypothetical protein
MRSARSPSGRTTISQGTMSGGLRSNLGLFQPAGIPNSQTVGDLAPIEEVVAKTQRLEWVQDTPPMAGIHLVWPFLRFRITKMIRSLNFHISTKPGNRWQSPREIDLDSRETLWDRMQAEIGCRCPANHMVASQPSRQDHHSTLPS